MSDVINNKGIYSERDLLRPALGIIQEEGGTATTTHIIEKLIERLKPSDKDLEILFGRNDSRFSQKVRNLISHKTITRYADHDPLEHSLTLNEKGALFLQSEIEDEIEDPDFDGDIEVSDIEFDEVENFAELVQVDTINKSVFELKRKYDRSVGNKTVINGLILDETFQRTGLVWSEGQKSKLIESVLLGIPLPVFYLAEDKSNNLIVIDGRQRLTALFDFLDGKYSLKGLEFYSFLNGKRIGNFIDDLAVYKAKIEDTALYVNKIKVSTPEFLKLQIFARINKQGTQLNAQEMRHALHQGASTFLLSDLSKDLDISVNNRRMKDRYLLLRYICLNLYFNRKLYNYKKRINIEYTNINDFLGKGMDAINTFTEEQIKNIEHDVKTSLEIAKEIFGTYVFRLKKGSPINMILFEVTMLFVSLLKDNYSTDFIEQSLSRFINMNVDMSEEVIAESDFETPFEKNIRYHRDSKDNFLERVDWIKTIVGDFND